eukprot:5426288-Prymnesium_polylepis.1
MSARGGTTERRTRSSHAAWSAREWKKPRKQRLTSGHLADDATNMDCPQPIRRPSRCVHRPESARAPGRCPTYRPFP